MCQPAQRAAIIAHPQRPVNPYLEEIPIHVFAFVFLWEGFHLALIIKVFRARRAEQQVTVHIALAVKTATTIIALPTVVLGHGGIIPFFLSPGQLLCCTPEAQKLGRIAGPVDLAASNAHGGDKLDLDALGLVVLGHGEIISFFFCCRQPLETTRTEVIHVGILNLVDSTATRAKQMSIRDCPSVRHLIKGDAKNITDGSLINLKAGRAGEGDGRVRVHGDYYTSGLGAGSSPLLSFFFCALLLLLFLGLI